MKRLLIFFIFMTMSLSLMSQQNSRESFGMGDVLTVDKSRGMDENVKVKKRVNGDGIESRASQPADKGGISRGSYCKAYFDNNTKWYIDCYVDGYYEGYVAPWGDGSIFVDGGVTKLYAKAEFTDGSWKSWGPVTRNCEYNVFEMKVYESRYTWQVK
jgi:hypothetical protein